MTSYIDGENGLTNFANIMGENDSLNDLTVNSIIVNENIQLPSSFSGINLIANEIPYNITRFELSNIANSRGNLQQQIDDISPDSSTNMGYWGTVYTNTDLSNPSVNNVNLIPFTNIDPSSNGVVYNNTNRLQVTNEGVYLFIITAQVSIPTSNTETISMWIRKNGVNVPDSAFQEQIKSPKLICANWQLPMNSNDYIQFCWSSTDIHATLEYFAPSGNVPAIPSVIVTVSQVTFYQNNTAMVNGILQRIQGINYTDATDTTNISNNLDVSGNIYTTISGSQQNLVSYVNTKVSIAADQHITGHKYLDSGLTVSSQIDLSGNLNVVGNINTTINGSQQNIVNYVNNINTQVGYNTQKLTGISYDDNFHLTNINNNVNITGYLNTSIQGQQQNLVVYVDQQVAIAYDRGTQGVNAANNAQNSANNAQSTADGALSLASGASAGVAGLAGVVAQHTTDIAALGAGLAITDANVATLQVKTQNMSAIVGETTFAGQIINGDTTINPISILTPTLDAETAVITPSISSNTGVINVTPAVQNFQGTTINIGASTGGSAINIGTDGLSNAVSIGNLTTPVYINSTLYVPFTPANLTSFLRQFAYTV